MGQQKNEKISMLEEHTHKSFATIPSWVDAEGTVKRLLEKYQYQRKHVCKWEIGKDQLRLFVSFHWDRVVLTTWAVMEDPKVF